MTAGFNFYRTPQILFGIGVLEQLPEIISRYGKSVLAITGASSFPSTDHWDWLNRICRDEYIEISHVTCGAEPSPQLVDNIKDAHREHPIDVVLGIGGGSVLDAAKAISAMLGKDGSVGDYLEGVGSKTPDGSKVPLIAVPTTSGTGTEATKNAVLSEVGPQGFKKSLRHDNYVPEVALIDPRLMLSCPPDITAACGMDTFTQLLESYLSPNSGDMLDSLVFDGLVKIKNFYLRSVEDGSNIEARSGMAYASLISGIGLANAGLGIVHGFASPLGGLSPIPHGVVCGTLMAPATRANVRKIIHHNQTAAKEKYTRVGRLFSNVVDESDKFYCHALVEKLEDWSRKLDIPYLSDYGITANDVPRIIEGTGMKNNPVSLEPYELEEILLSRIH